MSENYGFLGTKIKNAIFNESAPNIARIAFSVTVDEARKEEEDLQKLINQKLELTYVEIEDHLKEKGIPPEKTVFRPQHFSNFRSEKDVEEIFQLKRNKINYTIRVYFEYSDMQYSVYVTTYY